MTTRMVQGVLRDGVRDDVAVENPREIQVDGRPLAVTMPDRASTRRRRR